MDEILILGGGRTGIALHNLLEAERRPHEWIADTRLVNDADAFVARFGLALVSPGICGSDRIVAACERAGIPVRSELDYAASRLSCPILGVTGTNGKTTVTKLLADMCRAAGYDTYCVGNVGVPLSTAVGQAGKKSIAVVEVSSFMLERSPSFHPAACCVTNITPDHLDRHGSMAEYAAAKSRIFAHCEGGDGVILNADDPIVSGLKPPVKPKTFSVLRPADAWLDGDRLILCGMPLLSRSSLLIKGNHNVANVLCAALTASAFGIPHGAIERAARSFGGVAHRVEYAGTDARGVRYYNDSKATNIESALAALAVFHEPLVLIAGGSPKGYEFDALIAGLPENCRRVVATGETAASIAAAAARAYDSRVMVVPKFSDAVAEASAAAERGGVVLLSPACASFDAFRDYRERGDAFLALAERLGAKK